MNKIYPPIFFAFLFSAIHFSSCVTRIQYVGSGKVPTTEVEVFTNAQSIDKDYKEIGKGFIRYGYLGPHNLEKVQKIIVEKAKQKGADAVLIQDYYIPNTGANINSVFRTDSIGKAAITTGVSSINQTGTTGLTILFLKYE